LKKYQMWIGGEWVDAASGKTLPNFNPTTEEEIGRIALGDAEDVDKAVKAAQKAFPIWSKFPQMERNRILQKISGALMARVQEIIDIDVLNHGTPISMANGMGRMAPMAFATAGNLGATVFGESEISQNNQELRYYQREPIGVCAAIEPWNVPIMIGAKIASSLASGNTCVVKPPSICCLTAQKVIEIIATVSDLPPGTVNLVTGPGNTVGQALACHPGVGMVSFTGSCETGKAIMAAASKTVKRLTMELGGKNPFIVLEDADMDRAVAGGIQSCYVNTGMICGAPGRFYIQEKLYDEFIERFVAGSKKHVVGLPTDKNTQMGPVVSAAHRDKVESYFKIGVEEGAKLVLGGKRPTKPPLNKGFFIMPTVFTDVTQNMRLAREEIFGPVACIMKFSTEEEVLRLANDNTFGLAASVWTRDLARGRMFANELQAGTVTVNQHSMGLVWGGYKESGFGKTNGVLGQEEYTQIKAITLS
jgi:acyl-CoA reductase-like NAD-dependent aldehyde dehydrogenase